MHIKISLLVQVINMTYQEYFVHVRLFFLRKEYFASRSKRMEELNSVLPTRIRKEGRK